MSSNVRLARTLVAIGAATALTAGTLLTPAASDAAARITCRASVTPKHPTQYSNINVVVRTKAKAKVKTTAHYKTTNTTHAARANSKGVASITYYISGASHGRKVPVSVKVTTSRSSGTCSTSFTPR